MRAFECQTHRRNESKFKMPRATCSIDRRNYFCIVLSMSITVMTRVQTELRLRQRQLETVELRKQQNITKKFYY